MFFGKKKDASEAWKTQGKGAEQRVHPRMGLKTLVTVRHGNKESHCKMHDISLGGLAFISPWQLESNDAVSLILNPPEGVFGPKVPKHPAYIDARVCRTIPSPKFPGSWQVGVRFMNPSPEAEKVIRLWFESFGEAAEKSAQRSR